MEHALLCCLVKHGKCHHDCVVASGGLDAIEARARLTCVRAADLPARFRSRRFSDVLMCLIVATLVLAIGKPPIRDHGDYQPHPARPHMAKRGVPSRWFGQYVLVAVAALLMY